MSEDLKSLNLIVRSTLMSSPEKMTVKQLRKDFKENYGREFPYFEFGFKSFMDYLYSIPDVVVLEDMYNPNSIVYPVVSERSQHVTSLVSKQKKPTKNAYKRKPFPFQYFEKKPPPLMSLPKSHWTNNNHRFKPNHASTNKIPPLMDPVKTYRPTNRLPQEESVLQLISDEIKRLIQENNGGISFLQVSNTIISNEKYKRHLSNLGITSIQNLLQRYNDFSIKDGIIVLRKSATINTNNAEQGEGNHIAEGVFLCKSCCSEFLSLPAFISHKKLHSRDLTDINELKNISQNIIENVQNLLSEHPNGLMSDAFLNSYKEKYNSNLNLQQLGFKSLDLFLEAAQNIVHLRYAYNTLLLFPKILEKEDNMVMDAKESSNIPKSSPFLQNIKLRPPLYPEEVCEEGVILGRFTLQSKLPMVIQVRIMDANSPECFWMMVEDYWDDLIQMMNEINEFYNNESEYKTRYVMPERTIREGQLCVALYNNYWHRAKIIGPYSPEEVEVEYVDFGTVDKIPKSQLRFMHRDFAVLPHLSIRAKLFGIEPVMVKWSYCGLQDYIINKKSFLAEVNRWDPVEAVAEVTLLDPSTNNFILNASLLESGDAVCLKKTNKEADDSRPRTEPHSTNDCDTSSSVLKISDSMCLIDSIFIKVLYLKENVSVPVLVRLNNKTKNMIARVKANVFELKLKNLGLNVVKIYELGNIDEIAFEDKDSPDYKESCIKENGHTNAINMPERREVLIEDSNKSTSAKLRRLKVDSPTHDHVISASNEHTTSITHTSEELFEDDEPLISKIRKLKAHSQNNITCTENIINDNGLCKNEIVTNKENSMCRNTDRSETTGESVEDIDNEPLIAKLRRLRALPQIHNNVMNGHKENIVNGNELSNNELISHNNNTTDKCEGGISTAELVEIEDNDSLVTKLRKLKAHSVMRSCVSNIN